MADFALSAFAMFFMQSASFLSFQRKLEKGQSTKSLRSGPLRGGREPRKAGGKAIE